MDDEFDNFMEKVTEIERLVRQMRCPDGGVAEGARRRADQLLGKDAAAAGRPVSGEDLDRMLQDGGEGGRLRIGKDRTVINYKALAKSDDPAEMSKEAFMAQVERDAENRTRDRRERRQRSDEFKRKANQAFREKRFEKALDFYSKAVEETRDSAVLYENRALTCLNLELYQRTVDDCDRALRLNESSLKALLYKAKALHWLKEEAQSEKCLVDAEEKHPQHQSIIKEYREMWTNDNQCLKKTE